MAQRHQRGWLKKEHRKEGETWMLYFRTLRESDGKRVENKTPIGLVKTFPSKASAWREVERQHLHINETDFRGRVTFADLADHYIKHELGEQTESVEPEGPHNHRRIPQSATQSPASTLGRSCRSQYRAAGDRKLAARREARRRFGESHTRQSSESHESWFTSTRNVTD